MKLKRTVKKSTLISAKTCDFQWFLPRDAMLARYMLSSRVSIRLSVRHKSALYRSG